MKLQTLAVMVAASSAFAQSVDTSSLLQRGSRAEGSIALPSARLLERGAWEISLGYGHEGDVVRVATPTGDVRGGALVKDVRWVDQRDLAWVHLAVSPLSRFELNAVLPVLLGQSSNAMSGIDTPMSGRAALGDASFGLRFALLERKAWTERGLNWTIQGGVIAPTGAATSAFSERTARADASTTATWQSGGAWAVTAHAGYQMGAALQLGNQLFGDRLIFGGAFAYRWSAFQLHADVVSQVNLGAAAAQTTPGRASLELLGGGRYVHDFFFADLGVGVAPVDDGVTPRWRLQLALGARGLFDKPAPPPVDLDVDRDGVLGDADQCPSLAEDHDGFEDGDGCPDPDDDKDGVPDARDACSRQPEDMDGVADADGCPETDADSDGVPDEKDQCPLAAEDYDGFEDGDGCPEAGSIDPSTSFRSVSLPEQAIFFEVGSATLDANALSTAREVARTLLKKEGAVQLTGHADDQGPEARNDELSLQRAEAVKKVLVEAGVAADRLSTRGAGRREPVTQSTGFGRSLNRSVTFAWAK
jgi:outer membrane protein OmpA-like peptidoglycan-associated protein